MRSNSLLYFIMLHAALQGLFPIEYSLDVVELVECVHRREVVDVEM